jgi:homoserine kinase type II
MTIVDIAPSDIRSALEQYALPEPEGIRVITGGQSNRSFAVTAGGRRYALTFCIEKTEREVQALASLLGMLTQAGYPTSRIVARDSGELYGHAGGHCTLLKEWIDGDCATSLATGALAALGVQLARLHALGAPPTLPRGHPYGLAHFDTLASSSHDAFSEWLLSQHEYLTSALAACTDRTLIHGDVFPDNVIVTDGLLAGIIDFEESCVDWAGIDLGMALIGFSQLPRSEHDWAHALLEGYAAERALPEAHLLPVFAEYAATATAFWRYRQYELIGRRLTVQTSHHPMMSLAKQIRRAGLQALSP